MTVGSMEQEQSQPMNDVRRRSRLAISAIFKAANSMAIDRKLIFYKKGVKHESPWYRIY